MKKNSNVVKFHRPIHFNLSIIICIIIFIYVLFHFFSYITTEKITIYEVAQGSIATNNEYTALALRQEEIVESDVSGYIYYYAKNRSRVGAKTICYAIDESGAITSKLSSKSVNATDINDEDLMTMESNISTFVNSYSDNDFYKVYTFKADLADALSQAYSNEAVNSMSQEIESAINSNEYHQYYAKAPGLIVYTIDGYEDVTTSNFTSDNLDQSKLETVNLKSESAVSAGQPIYKLITSDRWQLVLPVDQEIIDAIGDDSYIQIKFHEDNAICYAAVSYVEQAGQTYLILSLDDSVDRYANNRFLNIELILNKTKGLKIPITSITEKTFYTIPKGYFYQGADSSDLGVMIKGDSYDEFKVPTIYYESDDYYYIDGEEVAEGSKLIKADSKELYKVGSTTDVLKGVYNVNKGFTVFKQIEILYQTDDYAIIKSGTDYGISLYDHIVLQGDKVKENEIIN